MVTGVTPGVTRVTAKLARGRWTGRGGAVEAAEREIFTRLARLLLLLLQIVLREVSRLIIILITILSAVLGSAIGSTKGRGATGLTLGLILGPIGVLIIVFMPEGK